MKKMSLPQLRLPATPLAQLLMLCFAGLVLRAATFGDPNIYVDESFYLLVGHEMREGALLYVDIWDRKPPGIFLLYRIFAGFGDGVVAYQLGAWLSASLTAFFIARMASRWTGPGPAILAGITYLATANVLLGLGGQTPVFYNSLVAGAALLLFRYPDDKRDLRLYAAMLLLGIALTFKQPVLFEAGFFGLLAFFAHRNLSKAAISIALGILPWGLIAAFYVLHGHWDALWQAMVTANLHRPMLPSDTIAHNAGLFIAETCVLLGVALYAFLFRRETFPARIVGLWILAAAAGFLSVPFFIEHYALPLLVPLCVAASATYARPRLGPGLALFAIAIAVMLSGSLDFARHRQSARAFDAMIDAIGPLGPTDRLLVYDGPPMAYHAAGTRPMSPLAFPGHIDNRFEKDVSAIPTVPELNRLIAAGPFAVIMTAEPVEPPDMQAFLALRAYVRSQCARRTRVTLLGTFGNKVEHIVYSQCAKAAVRPG